MNDFEYSAHLWCFNCGEGPLEESTSYLVDLSDEDFTDKQVKVHFCIDCSDF